MEQECSGGEPSDAEVFLVECLAWGLLRAYGIEQPPVPVREMAKRPLPIFEHLSLLELNLGLYDVAYRTCLDGTRLIVVDLAKPRAVQRAGTARALYVAFCRCSRADELHWPCRERPYAYSDLFARCLLMPAAWMQQARARDVPIEKMAAHFDVPVRMANRRLSDTHRTEEGPVSPDE